MQTEKPLKIGITGGRTYENKIQIKKFLYNLREQTTNDVIIVSLGDNSGADRYVKKYALEFGYQYQECNPEYTNRNLYSVLSEAHYGKPYTARGVHVRDKIFCIYVDKCVVFDNTNMVDIKIINLVKLFTRRKKPLIVLT
tara:strand:+ start:272 stop:691 length:420 start_codon:yes stop_codon:yes gene_type:complete